jgi:hypothetical protein
MTRKQFKDRVTAAFYRANPTAVITGWLDARFVTYPTGHKGWVGKFAACAEGYRPKVMLASGDDDHVRVC